MAWKKPRVIKVDVYDIEIDLFDTCEGAIEFADREYQTSSFAEQVEGAEGFCAIGMRGGRAVLCIAIPDCQNRHTLLVHETAHAAHFILEHVCIPMTIENTEAMAYLQDSIFMRCAKELGMST
jgi:hypothetical protein